MVMIKVSVFKVVSFFQGEYKDYINTMLSKR